MKLITNSNRNLLVMSLIVSRLQQFPVVYTEDADLSANSCKLLTGGSEGLKSATRGNMGLK